MFGIGLPEMIVICAVALIVVGPDKLPDMARTVAKWVFELKKTVNQVKESLEDEDNLIGSVQSDLRETGNKLKENLIETEHFTFHEPGTPKNLPGADLSGDDVIDVDADIDTIDSESQESDNGYIQDAPDQDSDTDDPDSENKNS